MLTERGAAQGRLASVSVMTYRRSRLMSLATAGYGVFALAQPSHLPKALEADPEDRSGLELLAQAYGVRDLAVSALGVFGRSGGAVTTAMLMRIAMDLGDAGLLAARTEGRVRGKVLAVTVGWASLNALALLGDVRRARR